MIDDEFRRGLERLKGLLSHVDPHLTMGQLMGRLVREDSTATAPAAARAARRAGQTRRATSCRMPAAAPSSRTISACCAPPITATAISASDSAAPARIVRAPVDR